MSVSANMRPVADAGPSRYVAGGPLQLDGTRSYDPDGSGVLSYAWRQVSGPSLTLTDADSATPTISGPNLTDGRGHTSPGPIVQTGDIQECLFELVVRDGELASEPSTVGVVIVPAFGPNTLQLENPPFRTDRPTVIYFGGGDCVTGSAGQNWGAWRDLANVINTGYAPDTIPQESWRTYYRYGDMLIVYLSSVAPEYTEMIQTMGWSTGGQPAVDAAIRLNRFYHDPRYAVNHVTELDAPCRWQQIGLAVYLASNDLLHRSTVDGELLRHEHYWGDAYRLTNVPHDLVGAYLQGHDHAGVPTWYRNSLTTPAANAFNHGVVAGAFWSVVGPGKNLQVTTDPVGYYFHRTVDGEMVQFDGNGYPGRFPEPVTLAAWADESDGEPVLSCQYSENAVIYELLVGSDAHRVSKYEVFSETPLPPQEAVRDLPSGEVWWTIRVRDQYGSTIYADPIRLDLTTLQAPSIQNARTGKRYGLIEHALVEAQPGHHILLGPGAYAETIEFGDKPLTVGSLDPKDPVVVAGTIIMGRQGAPTVTYSGPESAGCILDGLTIRSDTVGVSCRDAAPTIRNCVVDCPEGIALEYWTARAPTLIDCTILGQIREGGDPGLIASWKFDETEGTIAHDNAGDNDATITGTPLWQPTGGAIGGALELDGTTFAAAGFVLNPLTGSFSVFARVKGGAPGQVILSQDKGANWLVAAAPKGELSTELKTGRGVALTAPVIITDGQWHRVGFVRDGAARILYVDDVEVARDAVVGLAASTGGLRIGADSTLAPGTFWSGLIDDVRIYDRAMKP